MGRIDLKLIHMVNRAKIKNLCILSSIDAAPGFDAEFATFKYLRHSGRLSAVSPNLGGRFSKDCHVPFCPDPDALQPIY